MAFKYVYDGWEDDEVLDKVFRFIARREIPLGLWEIMSKDSRNCVALFKRIEAEGDVFNLRIPYKCLLDWIEIEMYCPVEYSRLFKNIFTFEGRSRIWWWVDEDMVLLDSLQLYDWDMANDLMDEWSELQRDWYSEKRGTVFQKDRMHHFLSVSLGKWFKVRQFLTSGQHVRKKALTA